MCALMFAASAMAEPIFCKGRDNSGNLWSVAVGWDLASATVRKNNRPVQFGELTCNNIFTQEVRPEGNPIVSCHSVDVVDAGYNVYLYKPHHTNKIVGPLSQVWIGGTRPLAKLSCVAAMAERY